jgi:hypothetical protein
VDPIRDSVEFPLEKPLIKRKSTWCREILKEAEKHAAPKGTFRESKKPDKYLGLIAQLNLVIDSKPSTFDEAAKHKVWKDAMVEEYESILKNDVWEVVPRPQGKLVVTSKWIYKIKHATDGSVEKFKARFVARCFSQKEGIDYDEILHLLPATPLSESSFLLLQFFMENFTKWMLRLLFLMVKLSKRFISSNLRVL